MIFYVWRLKKIHEVLCTDCKKWPKKKKKNHQKACFVVVLRKPELKMN